MSQILVVFICLLAGIGLRRLRSGAGASIGGALNTVVIYVSLPALAITQLHAMPLHSNLALAVVMPWLMFAIAAVISSALGHWLGWQRETTGMMILTTGLGNTSFLGFPIIEALIGDHALPAAILYDQLGSFFVVSTIGILVAGVYSPDAVSPQSFATKLIKFPPFIATIFALTTRDLEFPPPLMAALERIALTLTPLALLSVGTRMDLRGELFRTHLGRTSIGLTIKMILMPIICWSFISLYSRERALAENVIIIEAAMPSMITAYLIGAEHKLDAKLGILMVTCGIIISMVSIPLWVQILQVQ